jgi:hypothetical protein
MHSGFSQDWSLQQRKNLIGSNTGRCRSRAAADRSVRPANFHKKTETESFCNRMSVQRAAVSAGYAGWETGLNSWAGLLAVNVPNQGD